MSCQTNLRSKLTTTMPKIQKYIDVITKVVFIVSLALLAGLMFLTAADVIGRGVGYLIIGSYQIIEIMQVGLICLAWPMTTSQSGHIRVDFFLLKCPEWLQARIDVLNNLIVAGIFGILTWQGIELVRRSWELHELISIIDIPLFPFQVVIPAGAAVSCAISLVRAVLLFQRSPTKGK